MSASNTCSTSHWLCRCRRTSSCDAASTSCACSVNRSCRIILVHLSAPRPPDLSGTVCAVRLFECLPQLGHLPLHLVDALTHLQDHLRAGEVDAEVVDPALDLAQAGDIGLRVEPDPTARAGRLDHTSALVIAQGLLVHPHHLCRDAADVARLV